MSSPAFIPAGSTILVTGVNGFLGAHVAVALLAAGYTVRGVVRSKAKADALRQLLPPQHASSMSFVYVEDITTPGAYHAVNALEGVAAVCHIASPLLGSIENSAALHDNAKDMLIPAIEGTLNLLRDAAKAPSVRRVIDTSSIAAVYNVNNLSATLTEDDWNPVTWDEAVVSDRAFPVYVASKKLAERAAWDFVEREKPHYDLVTFCPPFFFGAPVGPAPATVQDIPSTLQLFYEALTGTGGGRGGASGGGNFIDVRDLARAYVLALERAEARNQRFLLSGGAFANAEITAMNPRMTVSEWKPAVHRIDTSKAERILGFKPRDRMTTLRDTSSILLPLVP
jgi:nucleoside-diphosphate-sugar epimerase